MWLINTMELYILSNFFSHLCNIRSSHPEVFCKKDVLRNFAKIKRKHLAILKKLQACNFINKENLAQLFRCEFCEISKNTFSYRTPPVAASAIYLMLAIAIWKSKKYYLNFHDNFARHQYFIQKVASLENILDNLILGQRVTLKSK